MQYFIEVPTPQSLLDDIVSTVHNAIDWGISTVIYFVAALAVVSLVVYTIKQASSKD